jgi:RNA polymerase sigma-70 factor (ECF subfamily)
MFGVAAPGPPGPLGPDQEWQQQRLRNAIEALPLDLRQVLLLTEYSGLKQREIGQLLGIPAGTVASRRNTAIRHLGDALESSAEMAEGASNEH